MSCSTKADLTPQAQPRPAGTGVPSSSNVPVVIACGQNQNVRVNIHFMLTDDGRGNFTETNNGFPGNPSNTMTGYDYAASLIWACNGMWSNNVPLNLAPGSALTPVSKQVQLTLNGVYFHRNSQLQVFSDNMNPSAYLVDAGNTINVFLAELAPNAYHTFSNGSVVFGYPGIPAPTANNPSNYIEQGASNGGVACQISNYTNTTNPLWTCLRGSWTNYVEANQAPWQMATVLEHEIGHLLGLNHTWYQSARGYVDCADAPSNANCWNLNAPAGTACNSMSKVSNNVMDYNAAQSSLSPCQVNIIQYNLNRGLNRFVASCSSCVQPGLSLRLPAVTCGRMTNIWLDGQGSLLDNYFDLAIDKVTASGTVLSTFATTFWQSWNSQKKVQLDALTVFQPNSLYRVKVVARNNCGNFTTATLPLSTGFDATCISTPQRSSLAPLAPFHSSK